MCRIAILVSCVFVLFDVLKQPLASFSGSFFGWRLCQRLFQPLTQVANAILVFVGANITTMIFPDIRKCLSGNALW